MAKLVILTPGLPVTGRAHELNVDRTTIGRVEDNMFPIAEPSISSHHCEVHLRDKEILIRDLNSTNGTFINGEQITERVLKPGQTLRLGNVELKLEVEGAPAAASSPAPAAPKRQVEATMVIPRGVSLSDLESGGRSAGLDTSRDFSKKRKTTSVYFWIGIGIVLMVIAVLLYTTYKLATGK